MAAERQSVDQQQHNLDSHSSPSGASSKDDMINCVAALEAALLPCLPARELQAIDRSPHPSHQNGSEQGHEIFSKALNKWTLVDVERHARDFMEAAKNLQLYFVSLQREDQPTRAETIRKDIDTMQQELRTKNELILKQERLIQGWRKELKDQLDKHNAELQRV